ncbi:MAG: hypothetical protein MUE81_24055, partial [Thermoflexibacter sp.]|nr:hypothetical protein [Thermoflexibacter sp.]
MKKTGFCPITKQEVPIENLVNARGIGDKIREMIVHTYPDWDAENGVISSDALNQFRAEYVKKILEEEKGELSKLEIEVLDRISNFGTISKNVDLEAEEELNLGQRLADKVAEFGGSWGFILSFAGFIFIWIL